MHALPIDKKRHRISTKAQVGNVCARCIQRAQSAVRHGAMISEERAVPSNNSLAVSARPKNASTRLAQDLSRKNPLGVPSLNLLLLLHDKACIHDTRGALRMTDSSEYVPPRVWTWNTSSGGRFANINRPI